MKTIVTALAVLLGVSFGIYASLSLKSVMSGKFDWDGPFAVWIALGAIVMALFIANAAFHFKQAHRNAFGLIQIVIGCVILLSQIGASNSSDALHEMFALKFLAALFFFVQGFENWRAARVVGDGIAAR